MAVANEVMEMVTGHPMAVAGLVPIIVAEGHDRENPHARLNDLGGGYGYFVGANYGEVEDVADIANRVRKLLREYLKRYMPGTKVSVRRGMATYTPTIDIEFTNLPFSIHNPEWLAYFEMEKRAERGDEEAKAELVRRWGDNYWAIAGHHVPRYSVPVKALLGGVTDLLNSFNHDRGDSQSDYFDVRFYEHVKVAYDEEHAEFKAYFDIHYPEASKNW